MTSLEKPTAFFMCKFLFFDFLLTKPKSPFDPQKCIVNNKTLPLVCVIRILGLTPYGQTVCLYVHDFFPFFYVLVPSEEKNNTNLEQELCDFLESQNETLRLSTTKNYKTTEKEEKVACIYKIERVQRRCVYGYNDEFDTFLKVYVINPDLIKHFANLLKRRLFKNRSWNLYEVHITYMLHFLCTKNIYGCAYIFTDHNIFFRKEFTDNVLFDNYIKHENWNVKKKLGVDGQIRRNKYMDKNAPLFFTKTSSNVKISQFMKETTCDIECDIKHQSILNEQVYSYKFEKWKKKWENKMGFELPVEHLDAFSKLWIKEEKRCEKKRCRMLKETFYFDKYETEVDFSTFDILTERTKRMFDDFTEFLKNGKEEKEEKEEKDEKEEKEENKNRKENLNRISKENHLIGSSLFDNKVEQNDMLENDDVSNNEITKVSHLQIANIESGTILKKNHTRRSQNDVIEISSTKSVEEKEENNKVIIYCNEMRKDDKILITEQLTHAKHMANEVENDFENKSMQISKKGNETNFNKLDSTITYISTTENDRRSKNKFIASFLIHNDYKGIARYVYKKKAPKLLKKPYAIYRNADSIKKKTEEEEKINKHKKQEYMMEKKKEKNRNHKINIKYGSVFFIEILTEIEGEYCYCSNVSRDEIKALFYIIKDERIMCYYENYYDSFGIIATKPFNVNLLNVLKHNTVKEKEKEIISNLSLSSNINKINICVVENERELIKKFIEKVQLFCPISIVAYDNDKYNMNYINQRCSVLNIGNLYRLISKVNDQSPINDLNIIYNKRIKGRIIESVYKLVDEPNTSFENLCKIYLNVTIPTISKHMLYYWYDYCCSHNNGCFNGCCNKISTNGKDASIDKNLTHCNDGIEDESKTNLYFPCRHLTINHILMKLFFTKQIYEKINFLKKKISFAKYIHIDLLSLITRGSQFIIESFLLKMCIKKKFLLYSPSVQEISNQRPILHTPLVLQPKSSFHFCPLLVFDFQSLYASILIAFNICYTTCIGTLSRKTVDTNQMKGKKENVNESLEQSLQQTRKKGLTENIKNDKNPRRVFDLETYIDCKEKQSIVKKKMEDEKKNKEKIIHNELCYNDSILEEKIEEEKNKWNKAYIKEVHIEKNNPDEEIKSKKKIAFEFVKLGVKGKDQNIINKVKHFRKNDLMIASNNTIYVKKHIRKGICSLFLEDILKTRIMLKRCMDIHNNKEIKKKLQEKVKIFKLILNVAVGYIGANFSGRMPCVDISESVISIGKNSLSFIMEYIKRHYENVKVLYGDTDSLFLLNESDNLYYSFQLAYNIKNTINAILPSPMFLAFEKIYTPSLLLTKKRYFGFCYKSELQKQASLEIKGIESIRSDQCDLVKKILIQIYFVIFYFKQNSYFSSCCCCCYLCNNFFFNFFCSCSGKNSKACPKRKCFLLKLLQILLPDEKIFSDNDLQKEKKKKTEEDKTKEKEKKLHKNKIEEEVIGEAYIKLINQEKNSDVLKILNFLYREKYNHLLYVFRNFNDAVFKKEVNRLVVKHKDEITMNRHDCCLKSEANTFGLCLCLHDNENKKYKCDNNKCYCNFRQSYFFFVEEKKSYVFDTKQFYKQLSIKIENILRLIFNKIYANEIPLNNFLIFKKVKLGTYKGELENLKRKVPLPPQAIVAKQMLHIFKNSIIGYKEKITFVVIKKLKGEKMYNSVCHPFFLKGLFKSCSNIFKNYNEFFHHFLEKKIENSNQKNEQKVTLEIASKERSERNIAFTDDEKSNDHVDIFEESEESEESESENKEVESEVKNEEEEKEEEEEEEEEELGKDENIGGNKKIIETIPTKQRLQAIINLNDLHHEKSQNFDNSNYTSLSYKNEITELKEIYYDYYIEKATIPPLKRMLNLLPYYKINLKKIFYSTKRSNDLNKFSWRVFLKNNLNKKTTFHTNEKEKQIDMFLCLNKNTFSRENTLNAINKKRKMKIKLESDKEKEKEEQRKNEVMKSYVLVSKYQNQLKKLNHICLACAHSEIKALSCTYATHCPIYIKKLNLEERISECKENINCYKL